MVEHLPSKYMALSSTPITTSKKINKDAAKPSMHYTCNPSIQEVEAGRL
jgi:hypothetical protein